MGVEPSRGVEVSIPMPIAWTPLAPVIPVIVPWAETLEASDARRARRRVEDEDNIMKRNELKAVRNGGAKKKELKQLL
jgi:hypothetical protein